MLTKRNPISIDEAQEKINQVKLPIQTETIPVEEANHRVLATAITSPYAYPHFRRSGVDGFAIRDSDDHDYPKTFKVVGNIPAGETFDGPLGENETARIMTGAFVPDNADKVIMLEKTTAVDNNEQLIKIMGTEKHSNISEIGSEFVQGQELIAADTELNPGGLAILSAFGIREVTVFKRPTVAIITTGSELIQPDEPLQAGKIYNSNGPMIKNLVAESGGEVTRYEQLVDDSDLLKASLQKAIAENDIVITDGAVSVGDFDFVGDAARSADILLFNKIKMRPGSVTTAFVENKTLVMALSGNPGACFTGFYLYVEPVLRRFVHQKTRIQQTTAILAAPYHKTNNFDRVLRCQFQMNSDGLKVYPNGSDQSGALGNLQTTTCLVKIPHSKTPIEVDTEVTTWLLPFK
ncbi:molybdopterin molybdotransferase MoeA [Lactobacillus sp. LC28-10]|uniref:Molybdopterin molybdenumtransferase n=1 Tax=Secundilactobacillus angelensis TaxID=2722706 RepID=A0ABX1KXM6_9LACO|nr:molybdopterin molybdotransferase MoeA [Secundilactobacillus angelensis]MCH5461216.1 molybdopterin molybdotransferase MoeA [Secundilactobacillus angelensis]NLR17588.1 molybdopterin molybdotransferase MoeA [Secundilactobacillus angelensis]